MKEPRSSLVSLRPLSFSDFKKLLLLLLVTCCNFLKLVKKSFGEEPATPQKVGTCQLARKMDHISKEDLKIYNYLNVARKNAKLNLVASSLSGLSSVRFAFGFVEK